MAERATENSKNGIQVIERAASMLRALADHPVGMSLSELAKEIGLPRSTVHRLVTALAAEEFVRTGPDGGQARLGPGLLRLANLQRLDLRAELRPFLQHLSAEVGETVDLSILEGDSILFIDQVSGKHRLQAVSSIGSVFPAYCTANGKALLAQLPQDVVRSLLPSRLPKRTDATITKRSMLEKELEEVRRTGLAYDEEEHSEGISAIGTALPEIGGVRTALTVPMPTARFQKRRDLIGSALLRTRETVDQHFGFASS